MQYINYYDSPLGKILLSSDGENLCGLWFEDQNHYALTLEKATIEKVLPIFEMTKQWLDSYFAGCVPNFIPSLQLSGTKFQMSVWEILKQIPYGETVTYGEIADKIAMKKGVKRMSAQAVGSAVGYNPISIIIPCHRVIGANGSLVGYAGGLERKAALLALEKVDRVNLKK